LPFHLLAFFFALLIAASRAATFFFHLLRRGNHCPDHHQNLQVAYQYPPYHHLHPLLKVKLHLSLIFSRFKNLVKVDLKLSAWS
jgi:hypothetical protein